MRLVMMGTGPFGAPTFRALYDTHHIVVALVTGPLKASTGREPPPVSLMRDIAHEFHTPILEPEDVNAEESRAQLALCEADLLIVCDYGHILSSNTLATARLGGINLHASLLPKYRGAAPINWAIYNGDVETGASVIHMTPRLDAGPIVAQGRTPISPDETALDVENRLAEIGAWLVRRAIDSMEAGTLEALPQNPALASKAPRLKKTDGLIDWTRPALAIKNQVRAMEPWPKTYTYWHRPKGQPLRLLVGPVQVVNRAPVDAPPGTVLVAASDCLEIATGSGAVRLQTVQPAGKKPLSIPEFLRGYRVQPGEKFGPPA